MEIYSIDNHNQEIGFSLLYVIISWKAGKKQSSQFMCVFFIVPVFTFSFYMCLIIRGTQWFVFYMCLFQWWNSIGNRAKYGFQFFFSRLTFLVRLNKSIDSVVSSENNFLNRILSTESHIEKENSDKKRVTPSDIIYDFYNKHLSHGKILYLWNIPYLCLRDHNIASVKKYDKVKSFYGVCFDHFNYCC